jgi:hypothetical protein
MIRICSGVVDMRVLLRAVQTVVYRDVRWFGGSLP